MSLHSTLISLSQTDLEQAELFDTEFGHFAFYTHRSPDKITPNEDGLAIIPLSAESGVLVVADGLGGQPEGDAASHIALSCMQQRLAQVSEEGGLREAILDAIETANEKIMQKTSGGATTLAVVEIQQNVIRPYHIGDSMILVTGQRGLVKLQIIAHSPVAYAVEAGLLDENAAVHHEERHLVSNIVGATDMRIEIGANLHLDRCDTMLISSDGLFDNLYPEEIVEIIRKRPLREVATRLIELCRTRMHGGMTDGQPSHADDLSFILFRQK